MKFVCNNCGFTAEIPDRRTECPMCGSTNVTSAAVTSTSAKKGKTEDDEEDISTMHPRFQGPTQRTTLDLTEKATATSQESERAERKTRTIKDGGSKVPVVVIIISLLAIAAALCIFFFK